LHYAIPYYAYRKLTGDPPFTLKSCNRILTAGNSSNLGRSVETEVVVTYKKNDSKEQNLVQNSPRCRNSQALTRMKSFAITLRFQIFKKTPNLIKPEAIQTPNHHHLYANRASSPINVE